MKSALAAAARIPENVPESDAGGRNGNDSAAGGDGNGDGILIAEAATVNGVHEVAVAAADGMHKAER